MCYIYLCICIYRCVCTNTHTHTHIYIYIFIFVCTIVQSLTCVWFFVIPWTATQQAPLSSTICQSLLKFMSIELTMLSKWPHPQPLSSPFAFYLSQNQSLFQWVSSHQETKLLELQHQSLQWIFRVDFLVWSPRCPKHSQMSSPFQGTLKLLLQNYSLKVLILWCSAFFMVQLYICT